MKVKTGKQGAYGGSGHTMHMGIARVVVAKIVPNHHTASFQHPADLGGDIERHSAVEDRRKHREEQHQVERAGLEIQLLRVAKGEVALRESLLRFCDPVLKQIYPIPVRWLDPPVGETCQHMP